MFDTLLSVHIFLALGLTVCCCLSSISTTQNHSSQLPWARLPVSQQPMLLSLDALSPSESYTAPATHTASLTSNGEEVSYRAYGKTGLWDWTWRCLPWHKAVNGWQGLSTPTLRYHCTGSLLWEWEKSQTKEIVKYTALNGDKKETFTGAATGQWKHNSAGTHLKSPSSFSCCTSLNTIGLINTLLIIVPMMKYPKMLTGPSQPVLQRRKRSQLIIQAKGHSCTIRLKQSEPSAVSSLGFHRNLGRSFCISQYPQGRFLFGE